MTTTEAMLRKQLCDAVDDGLKASAIRDARIAELEDACRRALKIIEPNYLHQREKVADGIDILKRVLEANQEN